MKSTMSDRLMAFIKHTGLRDNEFAKQIGSTKQEISNWKSGQRISLRRIGEMLEGFPALNGHWILTGKGNMLNTDEDGNFIQKPKCDNPECISLIDNLESELKNVKEKIIQLQDEKIEWLEKNK
jgi:hypothetical protein